MDLNLVVLAGTLAVEPEVTTLDNGNIVTKLLVAVQSESRIDVITVEYEGLREGLTLDDKVHIVGMIQRRFWSGGQKTLRVVASDIKRLD